MYLDFTVDVHTMWAGKRGAMPEVERVNRDVVGAALIAGVGLPLCRLVLGSHLGELTVPGAAVPAAVVFVVVAVCVWVAGRYGFLLLWALLLIGWVMILAGTLADARREPFTVMVSIPDGFLGWSMMAVPLAFSTAFWARRHRGFGRSILLVGALWLALLVANALLARYAPDVGSTPRQDPALVWPVGVSSIAVPFLVSIWFIRWLYRS
jgi:hypothetical protein